MEWDKLFTSLITPTYEDIENYIGGEGKLLWQSLFAFMDEKYKCKPNMTYSVCSGKPGWNVKFQKSGQSFGTLYPEMNGFSIFIVVSYKLEPEMDFIKHEFSDKMQTLYEKAEDFMKNGKYMMYRIENETDLEDYKKICLVKLKPKKKIASKRGVK